MWGNTEVTQFLQTWVRNGPLELCFGSPVPVVCATTQRDVISRHVRSMVSIVLHAPSLQFNW